MKSENASRGNDLRPAGELQRLIAAARGEVRVDLLLRHAQVVNVFSGEIYPADVAIHDGHVVGLGAYPAVEEVDIGGSYLIPALMDGHVHLESAMVTPSEYARAVVPRGTAAVFADPHEIANVLGLEGVRSILEASAHLPLDVYVMLPSCVPATDLETAGARLGAAELALLLQHPRVVGLAEMMNYPGVLFRDPVVMDKLSAAGNRPVDGHAPGLTGRDLAAYVAAGIGSDHECTRLEEAREKLRLGMHILIREGTTARNLEALLPLITPENACHFSFCTDDRHPADLLGEGHMDSILRAAIRQGLPPVTAIRMATLHTARYFGIRRRGAIAPGYRADFAVLDNLQAFHVRQVYLKGRKVAEDGQYLARREKPPKTILRSTINVNWMALDFSLPAGPAGSTTQVRVIELVPLQIVTRHGWETVPVGPDGIQADPARDLLKIAVVERHLSSGNIGVGLVRGFGLKRGALASSVAHDSHNIVVIGTNDADMATAVIEIGRLRGGQVVVADNEVLASVPLPIAGLMSDLPIEQVRDRLEAATAAAHGLGCVLPDPLMTMSFLALPVIPELKLTDKGLVDVVKFAVVPLTEAAG